MTDVALSFRDVLLLRAVQLHGGHIEIGDSGAEDLVQGAYLAFIAKPPKFRSKAKLLNWFRIVMQNLNAKRMREFAGEEPPVSWDAIEEMRNRPRD
jgi:DNA-directed RNA polymerase specialized sigma24 family protein